MASNRTISNVIINQNYNTKILWFKTDDERDTAKASPYCRCHNTTIHRSPDHSIVVDICLFDNLGDPFREPPHSPRLVVALARGVGSCVAVVGGVVVHTGLREREERR